jgi:hypothetical protein
MALGESNVGVDLPNPPALKPKAERPKGVGVELRSSSLKSENEIYILETG